MLSQYFIELLFIFSTLNIVQSVQVGCEYNSTTYPIDAEWILPESCQTCKCLSNQIVICRNQTCQMLQDCRVGEQLTLKTGACCPTCSPVRRSCLYDSTAILHNTIFYPNSCLQCRCRDGQLFCDDICRQSISQRKCSFDNEQYDINSYWSPASCVVCQCVETSKNKNLTSVCYIQQCPKIPNCDGWLEYIPGQCCPVCQKTICRDNHGLIYQSGDVWTKNNACTHCTCRNGTSICSDENCPVLKCNSNEKLIRLPNTCCAICSNRHVCRFNGNSGYQTYYERDIWYTSACQYCTCRRHNRVVCKSVQCEHQFCLDHEIQESRSDSCCVSCREAKQCRINSHLLKEGSYHRIDNTTLCTCTSDSQTKCYSNSKLQGYSVVHLKASSSQRNHTITIADSLATIISYSKTGGILPSSKTRSLLFQFSAYTVRKSKAAVLLGIIQNSTGQASYRLILVDFDATLNHSRINNSLSTELHRWTSRTYPTQPTMKTSISIVEDDKTAEQNLLIFLIIILSLVCFILVLIILLLCYRRKQKANENENYHDTLKRPNSSLSIVEKFQAPDLTTKVTLLSHYHFSQHDLGTDV